MEGMDRWDAFEEDIPADDEEREVVVPVERERRSPDPRRFGGLPRGSTLGGATRIRRLRARPRPGTSSGSKSPSPNRGGAAGSGKTQPKPPHVQTVQTKTGQQVNVNNKQVYVSSKVPPNAIPIQKRGSVGSVGAPVPSSPPASPTKIQPSSQSWGSSAKLPGSSAGKSVSLPGSRSGSQKNPAAPQSKSAPTSPQTKRDPTSPKRQEPPSQTPPAKKPKLDNTKTEVKPKASSGTNKKGQASQSKTSTSTRSSNKANTLQKPRRPKNSKQLRQYLKTKAYKNKKQEVLKAYGLKASKSKVSEQKYLRAIQLQKKLYKKRKIQNNPLETAKTKLSNQDAVADMPDNPSWMRSSVRTLSKFLDKHKEVRCFCRRNWEYG